MLQPLTIPVTSELVDINDVQIEVERRGHGAPLVLLPGEEGLEVEAAFLARLAERYEVILLWPPGFGRSNRPEWVTMDDVSYLYLDVLERLGLNRVPVVGCSMGGWIAVEMATKSTNMIEKLALIGPYGIKVGRPTERDIADIYAVHPKTIASLKWRNPENGERNLPARSDEELYIIARNIESTARLCWEPYMHNPKLRRRLHRVKAPTQFIWGAEDGIVKVDYGRAYAAGITGAQFTVIAEAGHYPHIEQPEATLSALFAFLG